MDLLLTNLKSSFDKITDHLKEDLKSIRTGTANPALVENLSVETYGGSAKLRLLELATIVTEGPAMLAVMPFDPSIIADVQRAILKSPLGLSARTQNNRIMIAVPVLSQEQREKYLKLVGQKIEEHKNHLRQQRDDARKKIKADFETKNITEDDKFRLDKEIDNLTQQLMEEIQLIKDKKENEIRQV